MVKQARQNKAKAMTQEEEKTHGEEFVPPGSKHFSKSKAVIAKKHKKLGVGASKSTKSSLSN